MSTEKEPNDELSPYCKICEACGIEGCCSPLACHHSPDGEYCKGYIKDLRFGYRMFKDTWDLIPKDPETQKKLDKIYDENYEIEYKREDE